uniref:C2H2-type domain-containing protein n=1 Tax=Panagrolaimus superbus TaxID=310955 RepID=A0A914Y9J8_9BILA
MSNANNGRQGADDDACANSRALFDANWENDQPSTSRGNYLPTRSRDNYQRSTSRGNDGRRESNDDPPAAVVLIFNLQLPVDFCDLLLPVVMFNLQLPVEIFKKKSWNTLDTSPIYGVSTSNCYASKLGTWSHIRELHELEFRIKCPFCPSLYTYGSLQNHLNNNHVVDPAQRQNNAIANEPIDLDYDDYNVPEPMEFEENNEEEVEDDEEVEDEEDIIVTPAEGFPNDSNLSPMEQMRKNCETFGEKCFEKWLQFSAHPDATIKSASLSCDFMMAAAMDVIEICKPLLGEQTAALVLNSINNATTPMKSQKQRMNYLKSLGYFVEPKSYVIDYENVDVRTHEGVHLDQRKATIAMPSIKESLLAVLNNEEISNALVMPSDFTNATEMNHPFCGTRTQDCLAALGEDFLALQLFMDEFTSTCPIGSKSTCYKMAGCYVRLLNLPVDLLSKLDHVFLCFIAHASEMMAELQIQLSKTVIVELKNLETHGITVNYRGNQRHFKVILSTLAADNLGIHQLGGLILSFSSHNVCRMCTVTAESLKGMHTLDPNEEKTAAKYDAVIQDIDNQWEYGIRQECSFNSLENFHIISNVTVDIMHDLLEGHFQRMVPMVVRDAMANGFPLRSINNAIKAFQFLGPDKENPPNTISLPARAPDNGDTIKMGANEMMTLVKLLPLIFRFAGFRLNTPIWQLFLKLQRIIDIIWAHVIDENTTAMLDQLIQNYLRDFHALGGNMTIKAHLPLHYPRVIREMGPLRYLSSMRFEAKHRPFKQYAKVNRCHKNLPMTLASKSTIMFANLLHQMKKGNYISSLRKSRSQGKYKRGLAVVYGINQETREPVFGEIQFLVDGTMLQLICLTLEEFDERSHCYVIRGTSNRTQVQIGDLKYPDPVPIYTHERRYIQMLLSATAILRAACDSVTHLDGQMLPYTFEKNACARDLVEFVADECALDSGYMFQLKCKTLDINGQQKITTLVPVSPVNDGETYFLIISTLDECETEINPSQMVPQSPMAPQSSMTPRTSQQHRCIFGEISSPSRSFSALSFHNSPSEVHGFPGNQTSQYMDPNVYNTTPRASTHHMRRRITPTIEISAPLVTSAVSQPQNRPVLAPVVEEAAAFRESHDGVASVHVPTVPVSSEASTSAGGLRSTETAAMGKRRLSHPLNYIPGVNKGKFLGLIYSQNKSVMDEAFETMTREHFLFYDININERMRIPRITAAFVLLGPFGFADYDIRIGQLARDVTQKFIVDLVMEKKKSNPMTRDTVGPLVKHLNAITQGNFFDYLITADGPLFAAIRKREYRESASNGFIPAKKLKFMLKPKRKLQLS